MKKTTIYFLIIMGVWCSSKGYTQDAQCIFDKYKHATVEIEYKYKTKNDGDGKQNGTGFIVSTTGHIVTNAHVIVPKVNPDQIIESSIFVRIGGLAKTPIPATVLDKDINNLEDLALIRLNPAVSQLFPTLPVSYVDKLPGGSPLIGLGFASGSDIAIVPPAQKISDSTLVDGKSKPWWQTSLALSPGNSGGPVFGKLGTVVGIAVAINTDTAYRTYVIPIARAQVLLDQAGVKTSTFGNCADFPVCRHPTHGLERYAIDESVSEESDWEPGGGNPRANQDYWCSTYRGKLEIMYPDSSFTKNSSRDSQTTSGPFNSNVKYKYICEYKRLENPIFKEQKSAACLR